MGKQRHTFAELMKAKVGVSLLLTVLGSDAERSELPGHVCR